MVMTAVIQKGKCQPLGDRTDPAVSPFGPRDRTIASCIGYWFQVVGDGRSANSGAGMDMGQPAQLVRGGAGRRDDQGRLSLYP